MQIKNSVFLVTGGASGLGAATARMAAENGGRVVIADLQPETGEKLARELNGRFIKCDVTSEADGRAAVALALGRRGSVHPVGEDYALAFWNQHTVYSDCGTGEGWTEIRVPEGFRNWVVDVTTESSI